MDITDVFRSYVKHLKLQRSLIGVDKPPSLKFKSKKNEFNSKSKDIVFHITKLRNYLLEHKQQYTNINLSSSSRTGLSNLEREEIDNAARNIIQSCSTLLKELNAFIKKNSHSQLYEHQKGVLEIVQNYLKTVCKMYSDLKECHAKRLSAYNSMMKVTSKDDKTDLLKDDTIPAYNQDLDDSSNVPTSSIVEELTKEELQMFEVENADLISELSNLKGEVHAIEQKVTQIAGLQGTFTEMVLQQDADIQRIDGRLIGVTGNVQDGNQELRKALQNNASFRFYLLFFILMMSFTLLFLNWYNE